MTDFHELVRLPPKTDINNGLSSCKQSTMIRLFGKPGRLTRDCSSVTAPKLVAQLVTRGIGPFQVSGWLPAIDSLQNIFAEVKAENPTLYGMVKSSGMLCCRAVRGSDHNYSNHSWGTAIDLRIESQLDEMGAKMCQKGILMLYHTFHAHKWYWGAGFGRPDAMHFECSDELVREMAKVMAP